MKASRTRRPRVLLNGSLNSLTPSPARRQIDDVAFDLLSLLENRTEKAQSK